MLNHVTPWTEAHQAPLSMDFSRQEYWSVYLFPSPGDLPDPGIEPRDWIQGLLYCRQILYCLRHQGNPYHMNYSSPFYIHHSLVNLCFWQVGGMTVHQRIYNLICYHFSMVCNPTLYLFFFSSTSLLLPTHHPPPSCTHAQSCNPMDYSLPGSSVHGLFQARILEWVAISFSMTLYSYFTLPVSFLITVFSIKSVYIVIYFSKTITSAHYRS